DGPCCEGERPDQYPEHSDGVTPGPASPVHAQETESRITEYRWLTERNSRTAATRRGNKMLGVLQAMVKKLLSISLISLLTVATTWKSDSQYQVTFGDLG